MCPASSSAQKRVARAASQHFRRSHMESTNHSNTNPDDRGEAGVLFRQMAEANTKLLRGDVDGYRALTRHAHDFTLMTPFGGPPTRGSQLTNERWAEIAQFFKSGASELELVESYASSDLIVLVVIERQHAAVGELPDQEWSLRVTHVYRREGAGWVLVHRHADPIVGRISVERAAAIARGASDAR